MIETIYFGKPQLTEPELIEKMRAGALFERKHFYGVINGGLGNHAIYELDGVDVSINSDCIEISLWLGHIVVIETDGKYYRRFGLPE